ncbi:hypothetical protein LCGC14_0380280 [marine sediment metagenome]|uniref:Uncharacterized protein n=1 Tax=marine sediment metagenome TaxID=412755 RepID=A0A0F9TKK5_9ZZZZ
MPVIDHTKNINRIIARIKADTALFDSGKTPGKLREVLFGDPENDNKQANTMMPYAYVTTISSLQTSKRNFGVTAATNLRQVTIEYKITVVSNSQIRTAQAQQQLYDILKNLHIMVEADPLFEDPDAPGTGAIFSRSVSSDVPYDENTRGQLITSADIILLATIGETYKITFQSPIGIITLLSKPSNPDGIIFDENFIQNGQRNVTEKGDFGSMFCEYEANATLDDQFRAKYGTEETITLTTGGINRILNVLFVEINPTAQFDEIERSILHLEIIDV